MKIKHLWLFLFIAASGAIARGQGTVLFANRTATNLNAPVYVMDGTTRLSGSQFVAGLLAGPTTNDMALVSTTGFLTGGGGGYFVGGSVPVPGVPGGGTAIVQVIVWNSLAGTNFFSALSSGMINSYGVSPVFAVKTGNQGASPPTPPGELTGLTSFSLSSWDPLPAPKPPLFISRTTTNTLVLSWPFTARLLNLQSAPALASANWVTLTNLSSFEGSRSRIVLPVPAQTTFYRLVSAF